MMRIDRPLVMFLLVFVTSLAALTALWTWIAPGYGWTAATIAEPIFRLVERPDVTSIETRGAEIWVLRTTPGGELAPFTWFDRYAFFAVIPLLALICATPGLAFRGRLARLAIGLVVLVLIHALYLVASVELAYAAIGLRPIGSLAGRMLDLWQVVVRLLWEAAPIAIWIALCAGAWKRTLATMRAAHRERRSKAWSADAGAEGSTR